MQTLLHKQMNILLYDNKCMSEINTIFLLPFKLCKKNINDKNPINLHMLFH